MQVMRSAQVTDAERIAELERQLAYERGQVRLFMELCASWGTKNNELRRMLRDLGVNFSQCPEGM